MFGHLDGIILALRFISKANTQLGEDLCMATMI